MATGAPRWTYTIGAIIAAGGLVWAIASHFIPKPGTADPATAIPKTDVTVTGKDNIGVGTMSGGVVSNAGGSIAPTADDGQPAPATQ